MQKLHCKPGDFAIVIRGSVGLNQKPMPQLWAIGKVVQVLHLLDQTQLLQLDSRYPCWKLAVPMLGPDGRTFGAVYDAVLAPLPPANDVFEHDWQEFVKEHKIEIEEVIHAW